MAESKDSTLGCGILSLLFVFVLIACCVGIGSGLDQAGWIAHNHDTPVWIQDDWMVGEYRICQLMTATPIAGHMRSLDARAELPRLLCGRKESDDVAGSLVEFENAMPNYTIATDALWGNGDWSPFDAYFHILPVHYNGRIKRPDRIYDSWRCQRNGSAFFNSKAAVTCWALN